MRTPATAGGRPLRVLFIVEAFPKLSETFVVQLALECLDRGCDVNILTLQAGDEAALTAELLESGLLDRVRCLHVPLGRCDRGLAALLATLRMVGSGRNPLKLVDVRSHGRSVRNLRGLLAAARLSRQEALGAFDVIHAHFGKNGVLAMQLIDAALVTGPIVTSFHGQDVTAYPQRFGSEVYDYLFDRAAFLTAPSRFAANQLIRLGASENKTVVIPSPFDSNGFQFRSRDAPADGTLRLLTVGRLVEKKGTEVALKAVASLRTEHSIDVQLEIVGDGPLRDPLEHLSKELDIRDAVSFSGALRPSELPAAYNRSDVFLLPSITASDGDHEGLPVVLLEAQARGLPVVATRHGGIPEGVLEGKSAILVDERNPDQLARAIRGLFDDPALLSGMGEAGRRYIESNFTRERIGAAVVHLYRRVSS